MNPIQFVVPFKGVAQPRQKFQAIWPAEEKGEYGSSLFGICKSCGKDLTCRKCTKKKPFASPYPFKKDDPIHAFKAAVQDEARLAYSGIPLESALRFRVVFIFARPSAIIWKTKPMPRLWHAKIPDFDNLAKSVTDALKEITMKDDRFIASATVDKFIAAKGEPEMVVVEVSELPEDTSCWADQLIQAEANW